MDRRTFLGMCAVSPGALAGCIESDPDEDESLGTDDTETDPASANETQQQSDTTNTTGSEPGADSIHEGYETTTVRVYTPDGDRLGAVTAAIADTNELRYLGLSDTEYLPEDRGMLFVYESVDDRTFVMREMDFGIDIIYADADGTITEIHHAPEPDPDEDGSNQRYPGRGQYVLEVTYNWTTERAVSVGDVLSFAL